MDDLTARIDERIRLALAERDKERTQFWRRIWRGLLAIARAIECEYPVRPKEDGI
jgi:hypothetical protein